MDIVAKMFAAGLALGIRRGDEYMFNFLFANQL